MTRRSGPLDWETGLCSLSLGDFSQCDGTALHNTSQHQVHWVHYPWHPLYGKSIVVHGHLLKQGHELCRCLLPKQEARIGFEIPAWMLDRTHCAGLQLKVEPHVSWQALAALKQLWDEALAPAKALGQAASKNLAGDAYAQDPNQTATAPAQSVRSNSAATSLGGSASTNPPTSHPPVDAIANQPRGRRACAFPQRRAR